MILYFLLLVFISFLSFLYSGHFLTSLFILHFSFCIPGATSLWFL